MAKKIVCPNCKLPIEYDSKTCKFCGAEITERIEVDENHEVMEAATTEKSAPSKKKIPMFYLFFIIAAGLSVCSFLLPILPVETYYAETGYSIPFGTS